MKFEINKLLFPFKLHYFFFFAGLACIMPFLPVYIHQLGVSYVLIGDMYAVLPFSVILAKPLFGALADRFHKHKLIFLTSILITALTYFLINFVPERTLSVDLAVHRVSCTDDEKVEVEMCSLSQTMTCGNKDVEKFGVICSLSCRNASSVAQGCVSATGPDCLKNTTILVEDEKVISVVPDLFFSISSSRSCGNYSVANSTKVDNLTDLVCSLTTPLHCAVTCSCASTDDNQYKTSFEFGLLFCLLLLSYVFAGVVISIGDSLAMDCVVATKSDFGYQRVAGTVGWGLFAMIAGELYGAFSEGSEKINYSPGFYLLLVLLMINCFVAYFVKVYSNPKPTKMFAHLLHIYSDPRLVVFSLAVFIMGFMTSALWTFLIVYLRDMQASSRLLGYVMGVQCFGGELPLFLLSGVILKKFGHVYTMSICLLAYSLRYILYSIITDPWWVLPIEVTNGLTFGLFFATMVTFAGIVAPKGMSATTQGALQSIFEGFGVGIGNLVSGRLYDYYGGRLMYRILGVSSFICCVVYTISMALILKLNQAGASESNNTSYSKKASEVDHHEKTEMNAIANDST